MRKIPLAVSIPTDVKIFDLLFVTQNKRISIIQLSTCEGGGGGCHVFKRDFTSQSRGINTIQVVSLS